MSEERWEMELFVPPPEAADPAGRVGDVARWLRSAQFNPNAMVRVLTASLDCPVGLVDAEGRVLTGEVDGAALPPLGGPGHPVQRVVGHAGGTLVAQPIQPAADGPVNLWLVAQVPDAPAARVRGVSQALGVAAWAFVAYIATIAIRLERHGRHQEILLKRLLAEADGPRRSLVEQVTAAGWRLGGAHTGVHIRVRSGQADRGVLSPRLHDALADQRIEAEPIPDGPGWSFWLTGDTSADALRLPVRHALLALERGDRGVRLCAGIGTRRAGTAGLSRSLLEARQACVLAAGRTVSGAVEYVGADSVKRLLSHQCTPAQLDLARRLLRPLTEADAAGQLVTTLSVYLDCESSATATAATLGVHRNTVLQRLGRIRTLLRVDFDDADQRLALQLATRMVQGD